MTPRNKRIWLSQLLLSGFLVVLSLSALRGTVASTSERKNGNRTQEDDLTFSQTKQLLAPAGQNGDQFGRAVDIEGDIGVIGSPGETGPGGSPDQGSVYVFARNQGGANNWGLIKRITASDGFDNDAFGSSISLSGDILVVGAQLDDVGTATDQGSAYVFYRNQGGPDNWGEIKHLTASDGVLADEFGKSVTISGDTIIVGANLDNNGAIVDQGSAYIFERNQGGTDNWGETRKLTASDGASGDQFGWAVSLDGDTVIVSADEDDFGASTSQGSAYIFQRDQGGPGNWGQVQKIFASDGAAGDLFGFSVSLDNNTVVVGSLSDDVGAVSGQGSAYVFDRNTGGANNWGQTKKLIALDGALNDFLGRSVCVDGDEIIIGADADDIGANNEQGSAYTFERNNGGVENWGQSQKLTGSGGGAGDNFGVGVAVDGTTAIVGAWLDDVSVTNQGSAFVFKAGTLTASSVPVAGRVSSSTGAGLARATIYLSDQNGNTRIAQSNPFGFYSFDDVRTGQTYVISVSAKGYQFQQRVVTVNDAVNDLDFSADP